MVYLYDMGQDSDRNGLCWICGGRGKISRYHLALPLDKERPFDGSLPPGLYEFAGNLCEACAHSPADAAKRFRRWFTLGMEWEFLYELAESLKSQPVWKFVPRDAIILPLSEGQALALNNGRWTIVPEGEGPLEYPPDASQANR